MPIPIPIDYSVIKDAVTQILNITGVNRLIEKPNIYEFLSKHNLKKEDKGFQSIYIFSLIDYGNACQPRELAKLFGHQKVIDAFNDYLYGDVSPEQFKTVIDYILHTCQEKSFLLLKKEFKSSNLNREIDEFKAIFQKKTHKSRTPAQVEDHRLITEIADEIIKMGESHSHFLWGKELTLKIPKISPEKIIGREREIENLHCRLNDQKQVLVVNGLGGIGKTTLAQAYVGKYWYNYEHIAWISQSSGDTLGDFVNTEGLLKILKINSEGKDSYTIFLEIMVFFKSIEKSPNLLVVDNATAEFSQVYDYLPSQPNWHVLVTSRQIIEKFDLMKLDFLSEPEAVKLFFSHYNRSTLSYSDVVDVVNCVDLHTLTIEILAKTAQIQRIGVNNLKTAIETDLRSNAYINHFSGKIDRVASYLISIFEMSELNEVQIWLLQQLVFLPPEFHSYELLLDLIFLDEDPKGVPFSEILEELVSKGWVQYNSQIDGYKVHLIVGDVIKRQKPVELKNLKTLINRVSDNLSIDQAKDNPVEKFIWVPFGKLLANSFHESTDKNVSRLQNNLALVLQDLGDYEGALSLSDKSVKIFRSVLPSKHPYIEITAKINETIRKKLSLS